MDTTNLRRLKVIVAVIDVVCNDRGRQFRSKPDNATTCHVSSLPHYISLLDHTNPRIRR